MACLEVLETETRLVLMGGGHGGVHVKLGMFRNDTLACWGAGGRGAGLCLGEEGWQALKSVKGPRRVKGT